MWRHKYTYDQSTSSNQPNTNNNNYEVLATKSPNSITYIKQSGHCSPRFSSPRVSFYPVIFSVALFRDSFQHKPHCQKWVARLLGLFAGEIIFLPKKKTIHFVARIPWKIIYIPIYAHSFRFIKPKSHLMGGINSIYRMSIIWPLTRPPLAIVRRIRTYKKNCTNAPFIFILFRHFRIFAVIFWWNSKWNNIQQMHLANPCMPVR